MNRGEFKGIRREKSKILLVFSYIHSVCTHMYSMKAEEGRVWRKGPEGRRRMPKNGLRI